MDDSFTKVSESALLNVPGLRPLRRDLLQSALAFYEEFLRRGGDEPGVLADLAATQARVGQIMGELGARTKPRPRCAGPSSFTTRPWPPSRTT